MYTFKKLIHINELLIRSNNIYKSYSEVNIKGIKAKEI